MEENEHRAIAVQQFNRCWDLLEMTSRTSTDDAELLTAAFTSRFHWSFVGVHTNFIIADWMVSRAAAVVGEGSLALRFALMACERVASQETPDWMQASAMEGLARAYACQGSNILRDETIAKAEALVAVIDNPKEKELIASQLASVSC
jgi:hypothetical protein